MKATIELTGLRAMGTHGVLDFEKTTPQEFVVDVEMDVDFGSDDISQTVSYADVADVVVAEITGAHRDLIETLAADILRRLLRFNASRIKVRLHKPNAPIAHEFSDVSVTLSAEPTRAVVALGANLGDPIAQLHAAFTDLEDAGLLVVSPIYRTAAMLAPGQDPQPDYYNAVALLNTTLSASELLAFLQDIENRHGRVRTERWAARTLDLDLIAFGAETSASAELTLPHPRAHQRRFVLQPWADIDPGASLAGEPISELLAALGDQEVVLVQ